MGHLQNRDNLVYSFILGFFDGDGSRSTYGGNIHCSNIDFLKEIKSFLRLNGKIYHKTNPWSEYYGAYIPKSVFMEMYDYYDN